MGKKLEKKEIRFKNATKERKKRVWDEDTKDTIFAERFKPAYALKRQTE
jgi:hypothetical protein